MARRTESEKRAWVADVVARRKTIAKAAREAGVNKYTIQRWIELYGPEGAAVSFAPERPAAAVPAVGASEPVRPAAAGGYEAALAAAGEGDGQGEDAGGGGATPEGAPAAPGGAKAPPPEQVILILSQVAIQVSSRMYAMRLNVKWTDELAFAVLLTADEKATLETFAPWAAPYLSKIMTEHGDKIGAAVYALTLFVCLTNRFQKIKELAPKKEEPKTEEPQTEQAPTPAVSP